MSSIQLYKPIKILAMKTNTQNLLKNLIATIFMSGHLLTFSQSYSTFSFTSSNILDGPSQWGSYGCYANGNLINSNCLAVGLPTYFTGSYPIFSAQTAGGGGATSVLDVAHSLGTDKFLTYAYTQSNGLPFYKVAIYFSTSLPADFGGFDIINKSTDGLSKTFTIEGYKNNVLVATQSESVSYDIPTSITMVDIGFSDIDRIEIKAPAASDLHYFGVNNFLLADPSALPVELTNFNAEQLNNSVQINWTTISEYNSDYFIIEKSDDGYNWNTIDKLNGAGNNQGKVDYSIIDRFANEGETYYRLVQVDFNGKSTVYGPISVNYLLDENTLNIYPNPAKEQFVARINSARKQICTINVYSSEGTNVKMSEMDLKNGLNQLFFETNDLKPGVYFVNTSLNPEETIKLVIQ